MKNDKYTIIEFVKQKRKRKGCLVGTKIDGEVYIGWSLCDDQDEYNEKRAIKTAMGRAKKKMSLLTYEEVYHGKSLLEEKKTLGYRFKSTYPPSLNKQIKKFVKRCITYFRVECVSNFQDSVFVKLEVDKDNIVFEKKIKKKVVVNKGIQFGRAIGLDPSGEIKTDTYETVLFNIMSKPNNAFSLWHK